MENFFGHRHPRPVHPNLELSGQIVELESPKKEEGDSWVEPTRERHYDAPIGVFADELIGVLLKQNSWVEPSRERHYHGPIGVFSDLNTSSHLPANAPGSPPLSSHDQGRCETLDQSPLQGSKANYYPSSR